MNQQLIQQMSSSPLFKRAQEMCQGKSIPEIQQMVRNVCAQKGVDYDEALKEFRRFIGQ